MFVYLESSQFISGCNEHADLDRRGSEKEKYRSWLSPRPFVRFDMVRDKVGFMLWICRDRLSPQIFDPTP